MTAEITIYNARLILVKGDITRQHVDVIVNAANSSLMGGGGVDGAIHRAGGPAILEECRQIVSKMGKLHQGNAVITTGGRLPAKYVIHTVGPIWRGGIYREDETLASCYTESLKIAVDKRLSSIAFPAISTGVYGYPVEKAACIAIKAVVSFLQHGNSSIKKVYFVVYDEKTREVYSRELDNLIS